MAAKQGVKESDQPQVEKYLTEMKELPGHKEVKKAASKPDRVQLEAMKKATFQQKEDKAIKEPEIAKDNNNDTSSEERLITTKDILLGVINIASLALLIVLLIKLPEKAEELNKLRNQVLLSESEVALETSEVEGNKDRARELENLFIDDQGLVNFVGDVEKLKGESSSINKINITSQKAVKDKTGSYGVPVVIEMRGDWGRFGEDMKKIQQLPYLFRVIRIDSEVLDEEGVVGLKYGGFLYVDDKLGEN
jgi:hypothetical protein